MQMADIKLQHIPYKGGGQTINDLAGGHIPSAFLSLSAAKPLHDAGKIRIIGVAESKRYSELPNIPTIAETLPGFEMQSFVALVVPAGTPPDVIAKISEASARILRDTGDLQETRRCRSRGHGQSAGGTGQDHQGRARRAGQADQGLGHPAGIRLETTP